MIQWIGKLSFPYMNKILTSWHEQGFATVEEAESEKKAQSGKKENEATYDLEEIERFWDRVPTLKERKE